MAFLDEQMASPPQSPLDEEVSAWLHVCECSLIESVRRAVEAVKEPQRRLQIAEEEFNVRSRLAEAHFQFLRMAFSRCSQEHEDSITHNAQLLQDVHSNERQLATLRQAVELESLKSQAFESSLADFSHQIQSKEKLLAESQQQLDHVLSEKEQQEVTLQALIGEVREHQSKLSLVNHSTDRLRIDAEALVTQVALKASEVQQLEDRQAEAQLQLSHLSQLVQETRSAVRQEEERKSTLLSECDELSTTAHRLEEEVKLLMLTVERRELSRARSESEKPHPHASSSRGQSVGQGSSFQGHSAVEVNSVPPHRNVTMQLPEEEAALYDDDRLPLPHRSAQPQQRAAYQVPHYQRATAESALSLAAASRIAVQDEIHLIREAAATNGSVNTPRVRYPSHPPGAASTPTISRELYRSYRSPRSSVSPRPNEVPGSLEQVAEIGVEHGTVVVPSSFSSDGLAVVKLRKELHQIRVLAGIPTNMKYQQQ